MFEWNKKEAPLKALAGLGGGVGRGGGPTGDSIYVDDVFSKFINFDYSDEFLTHLNDVSNPLRFKIEKMVENKLSYIGLTVTRRFVYIHH